MNLNDGFSYVFTVQRGGQRLLDELARRFEHSAPSVWQARLQNGEVELDGVQASGTEVLQSGQRVVWHRPPWPEESVPLHFEVLYEDADLLAVSKPSGLPTMPGGGFLQHTLLHLVRQTWPSASPLHRLGRGTSGVVLFALTSFAASALAQDWREQRVQKHYRALSAGVAGQDFYRIDTPIGQVAHAALGQVYAASAHGKPALSLARVLERREHRPQPATFFPTTLFEVEIYTGRPHQIRIHLASIGLPLLGDPLYLAGGAVTAALPGELGYHLHAHRLQFIHPVSQHSISLLANLPTELQYKGQLSV